MPGAGRIVGSAVGGFFGQREVGRGVRRAIGMQREANELYRTSFEDTESDLDPFLSGGTDIWNKLMGFYGGGADGGGGGMADFMKLVEGSPDYQFVRGETIAAGDRSAASKGRLFSGGYGKELQDRASGLASTQMGNVLNRMMNLAGTGFQAGDLLGRFRQNYAGMRGEGLTNIGDMQLARHLGRADFYSNLGGELGGGFDDFMTAGGFG